MGLQFSCLNYFVNVGGFGLDQITIIFRRPKLIQIKFYFSGPVKIFKFTPQYVFGAQTTWRLPESVYCAGGGG